MRYLKDTMRPSTSSVDWAFGDALAVEIREEGDEIRILEKEGALEFVADVEGSLRMEDGTAVAEGEELFTFWGLRIAGYV